MSPTPEPDPNQSCNSVSISLMVCALVDALHCPKICNHLIAIAILLYHHYTKSSGESSEHVISAERDNLLDFAKCHHFPKNKSELLDYAHLALMFWSEDEGEAATHDLSCFWQNWLCGDYGDDSPICLHPSMDADRVPCRHVAVCWTYNICRRLFSHQTSLGGAFIRKH